MPVFWLISILLLGHLSLITECFNKKFGQGTEPGFSLNPGEECINCDANLFGIIGTFRGIKDEALGHLHVNGTVEKGGVKIAQFDRDGVLRNYHGVGFARIFPDGAVRDAQGHLLGKFKAPYVLDIEGNKIGFVKDGIVRNGDKKKFGSGIGISDRYNALFFFFLKPNNGVTTDFPINYFRRQSKK